MTTATNRSRPAQPGATMPASGEVTVEPGAVDGRREDIQLWIALLGALALLIARVALAARG